MLEKLLLNLDVGAGAAATRIGLGVLFVAAVRALLPGAGVGLAALALAGLLFLLKLFAAVARRLVPASPAVRARWDWRRTLARQHDSFQWRKLVWVGAGTLAAALARSGAGSEVVVGAGCVAAGLVAEAVWRRKGLHPVPPAGG